MIQHDVAGQGSCRMNSVSHVFTATDPNQVDVIWASIAESLEGGRTPYANRVTAHPTGAFVTLPG